MMILSIFATVVLLGVLFYHRVSLFLSSLILAGLDGCTWRRWPVEYLAPCSRWPSFCCRST